MDSMRCRVGNNSSREREGSRDAASLQVVLGGRSNSRRCAGSRRPLGSAAVRTTNPSVMVKALGWAATKGPDAAVQRNLHAQPQRQPWTNRNKGVASEFETGADACRFAASEI